MFLFNSLIVKLLSFLVVFKFVVAILFVVETVRVYTPVPPSQPEVRVYKFYGPAMYSQMLCCVRWVSATQRIPAVVLKSQRF